MKRLMVVLFAAVAACSRPMSFVQYREPAGEFSVEVPAGWNVNERGSFSKRPVGEVWWAGKIVDQHEGWPVGALLFVRKLDRHPDKGQERYRRNTLLETDALFSGGQPADLAVKSGDFAGHPARWFQRDFDDSVGGGIHGAVKTYPSRVSGIAIQTPETYYVLEYRATRELFDRYMPAFERLTASFKLGK